MAPSGRYAFEVSELADWLGGREKLPELCRQFGLPPIEVGRHQRDTSKAAVLLELARRMGRPIDVHRFIVQER